MSSLSKLAKVINSDKNINTQQYLAQIHNNMLKEVRKKKLSTEESQALKIQTFLRQIKYLQKYGEFQDGKIVFTDDFPFSAMWSKMSQMSLMNALYQAHPEVFTRGLFIKTNEAGEGVVSYKLGAYLEQGLAQVLNTFESAVTGESYESVKKRNNPIIKMGTQHTQVPDLIGEVDDMMKQEFKTAYLKTQEALKKYKNDDSNLGTFMPSVEGKIDVASFTGNINIGGSTVLSPYTKGVLNALKGATFTAKNYISTSELKFGQTNPFRVFATVAPGGSSSVGRFYRLLNCFQGHNSQHSEAPTLFYRIRAIYELTGVGMKYTDSAFNSLFQGNGAKFLVWNSHLNGGEIYVIPTQKIVDELIEKAAEEILPSNWKDALYGPIVLPQVDIATLAQK